MKYYIDAVINNYITAHGRATRKEYWMFVLFDYIFTFAFIFFDNVIWEYSKISVGGYGVLTLGYLLVTACPRICVQVRRLHDAGRSGSWWLVRNVPIVGWYVTYLCLKKSKPNVDAYGRPIEYKSRFTECPRCGYIAVFEGECPQCKYKVSRTSGAETAVKKPRPQFCRKCGNRLIENSKFCSKCGTAVIEITEG